MIVLTYGSISGSSELLTAIAGFFNRFLCPGLENPIAESEIAAANGVTAAIDLVAWTLCDPGDSILFPSPTFYMLDFDLSSRTQVISVPVSTTGIQDPFSNEECIKQMIQRFDKSAHEQELKGSRPRVLFLCNPANPQGLCYSLNMLNSLAAFCAARQMNLVSVEIYSMSQFGGEDFISVLSIPDNKEAGVDVNSMVHCLYGLSKDFDMGGLRMGFLVTRNPLFLAAIKRIT